MKPPKGDYAVGYKRPPKKSQWKKDQSGNPRRRYPVRPVGIVELIDSLLLQKIEITENGLCRRGTKFEGILLQLWRKELDGDLRALAVRLKFQDLANQYADEGIKLTFTETDYTRALSAALTEKGRVDE